MENSEIKQSDFLNLLEKDLERDLNNLERENKKEREKHKLEIIELVKKMLVEAEKKTEEKLKVFYYWLIGVALTLLIIIIWLFFYFRNLSR